MAQQSFTMEARFGDSSIRTMVRSDGVERIVAEWDSRLSVVDGDIRDNTRQFVSEALLYEKQHGDEEAATAVCYALIWLAATGPHGSFLVSRMKDGGAVIGYEITRVGPTTFNFRLSVDDETGALFQNR